MVSIGSRCWIAIGAAIINNIVIIADCIIGVGAVVVKNLSQVELIQEFLRDLIRQTNKRI